MKTRKEVAVVFFLPQLLDFKLVFLLEQMQLDLSKGHIKALREGDLSTDSGIAACTSAAEALQEAMEVELPIGGTFIFTLIFIEKVLANDSKISGMNWC